MRLRTPSPLVPILALALALALAPAARAALVVVPYSGTITSEYFSPDPGETLPRYRVGQAIGGVIRLDTAAVLTAQHDPAGAWATYILPPEFGAWTVGRFRSVEVTNAAADRLVFRTFDLSLDTEIDLVDPTGTALTSTDLPTAIDPGRFASFTMRLDRESAGGGTGFRADLTAPAAVPEPATLGPALAGLAGLLAAAARGRVRRAG